MQHLFRRVCVCGGGGSKIKDYKQLQSVLVTLADKCCFLGGVAPHFQQRAPERQITFIPPKDWNFDYIHLIVIFFNDVSAE